MTTPYDITDVRPLPNNVDREWGRSTSTTTNNPKCHLVTFDHELGDILRPDRTYCSRKMDAERVDPPNDVRMVCQHCVEAAIREVHGLKPWEPLPAEV